jgi:hypothetical protein
MTLSLKDKILYHQIHPLKLAADIGCEPVSLYYFWHHEILLGLSTHFIPPIAATLLVVRYANLEPYKNSKAGVYLQRHMSTGVQTVRFLADLAMIAGAWLHQPLLIAAAALVIVGAWCRGLVRKS